MIYLYLFGTCFHFIYVFMIIAKYSSTALTRLLLYSSNILIKDCSTKQAFNNGNYIRIAIRNEADNNKLLSRLKELDC